jgi:pyridoxal phosphate enzyme (YggS family)
MIAENIQQVRQKIIVACEAAKRNPDEVTLIAVSKTHPVEAVLEAVDVGVQHFGENRVEEAEGKIPVVNSRSPVLPIWHMIGHLQSRKAKDVPPLFDFVHSVDTMKLADKLSNAVVEVSRNLDVLLEINVSGEEAKHGFRASGWEVDNTARENLWNDVKQILLMPGLRVRGLMTMAPIVADPEDARPVFSSLRSLRNALSDSLDVQLPDLSMGMTDDYWIAVQEGATMVRVGRAIFGEREK